MNKEDFIKLIDGEMWYKSDYAYWLYKQLEDRDNKINKAIEYIENHSLNFNGECEWELSIEECKELEDILRGEDNEIR